MASGNTESMNKLQKARSLAKGVVTRKINRLHKLMSNRINLDLVIKINKELKEAFRDFQSAHEEYHSQISQEDEHDHSSQYHALVMEQVTRLERDINVWLNNENSIRSLNPSEINPEDSASNVSYVSKRTSSSNSSGRSTASAKAKAAAKKAALETKAAALKTLHELQAEELKLQQKKSQMELKTEIDVAEAMRKVYEQAEVEEKGQFYPGRAVNTQLGHPPFTYSHPPSNPLFTSQPGALTETPPYARQPLNPNANEWGCEGYLNQQNPRLYNNARRLEDNPVQRLAENQDRQNEHFLQMMQLQQQGVMALSLPQPVMEVFSGNPVDYCNFIRAFENLVEEKIASSNSRLYYLVQYTTGSAQELMKSCLSMQDDNGYKTARRLLKERYGQNYRIAAAHVRKLIDGPVIKAEDGFMLQQFSVQLSSCVNTLKEIDCLSKLNSPENLKKIVDRLPYGIRLRWRDIVDSIIEKDHRDVTIEDVTNFVTTKARAATHPIFGIVTNDNKPRPISDRPQSQSSQRAAGFATQVQSARDPGERPKCPACGTNHWLSRCDKFRKSTLEERHRLVKDKRLCMNCLCSGHFVRACTKESFCKVEGCSTKHSTFLHPRNQSAHVSNDNRANEGETVRSEPNSSSNSANNGYVKTSAKPRNPLNNCVTGLAVVPVRVRAKGFPNMIETYAFLDSGSNTTFCTESLLQKLNIKGKKTQLSLTTIQSENVSTQCSVANLEIFDLSQRNLVDLPRVYSTQSLPVSISSISSQEDVNRWPHLKGIIIEKIDADIDLLIGSDVPQALQPREVRESKDGGPFATRTILGWVLNGPLGRADNTAVHTASFIRADEELNRQFESFCNLEFNDTRHDDKVSMSRNDRKALAMMEETVQLKDRHYELALPWKEYPPCLGNNKSTAEHRLILLKRRLNRDPNTLNKYKQFIDDLTLKRYARQITDEDAMRDHTPKWYLPHHPVYHPQKPDKVRVVFDCSATWRGISLNDQLLQGPDLTNSLVGVLTRFRQEPIAIMSDIEAMFHQVRVRPSDCNYLRFLWWPDGNLDNSPAEYQMLVHLFGATSSPSCANFALRKTAKDNESEFDPITVETVLSNFYVDDCLKSVSTTNQAIQLTSQLRGLLARGGFRLTKWLFNDQEVLNSIPESERAAAVKNLDFDSLIQRALGVQWKVQYFADVFWKRWIREYLPSLQERQKWNQQQRNFAVNDIVLILDENMPRSSWPLARIQEVHVNRGDNLVRSVKLKTRSSTLVRPVSKLILLEAAI